MSGICFVLRETPLELEKAAGAHPAGPECSRKTRRLGVPDSWCSFYRNDIESSTTTGASCEESRDTDRQSDGFNVAQ